MSHHALAAMGLLAAAILAPGGPSHAASADPTGFWMKPGSERNAKMQITRCGKGLCAKIVWLEDPNDSQGRPLRDIRNENPGMRNRTILGLPIFTGLARTGPSTWSGKIYNPEDGNTYSVTLTAASRTTLQLKGCKNWLMCGERTWLKTSPPPAEPKPEETIEAKAEPATKAEATPAAIAKAEPAAPAAPLETAKAEPASPAAPLDTALAPSEPQLVAEPVAEPQVQTIAASPSAPGPQAVPSPPNTTALPKTDLATTASTPAHHARSGYGFLNASTAPETATHYSGENVSSMFVMTKPLAPGSAAEPAAVQSAAPAAMPAAAPAARTQAAAPAEAVPLPEQKPVLKAQPKMQANMAPKPAPGAKPVRQAAPAPQETTADQTAAPQGAEPSRSALADTETAEPVPMTRRQKRIIRRQQQQPLLPWLRF